MKNSTKGTTLMEMLVAIAVFNIVILIIMTAYVGGLKIYNTEFSRNELQTSVRISSDRIASDIKKATAAVETYDIYSATANPDKVLILKVPSIDSNSHSIYTSGEIITFDYIIYKIEGSDLRKVVLPSGSSSRSAENRIILSDISNFSFSYQPTNPPTDWSLIDEIELTATLSRTVKNLNIDAPLVVSAKLRNK